MAKLSIKTKDNKIISGEFVRNYGVLSVQVRAEDGTKHTGWVVKTEEKVPESSGRLGEAQLAVLAHLKKNPVQSYRQIATACNIQVHRAATIVTSLVARGLLVKTVSITGNEYQVPK